LTWLQAVVLGIVQGLGEFLPISSSGHLIVVPWLMSWPDQSLAFDVALHLGTLAAVLGAFLGDWYRLVAGTIQALWGRTWNAEARTLGTLALASVPGAVAGLLLDKWAETTFRLPALVAVSMAVMGAVLFLADRRADPGGDSEPTLRDALLIGAAQALALVPGVSRSGATISMALFLGYRRGEAARFSFLLATPITAGAALVKVPKLFGPGAGDHSFVLLGILISAVVGLLSIRVLLAYVRTRDYRPFVFYRFGFALLVAAVLLLRG